MFHSMKKKKKKKGSQVDLNKTSDFSREIRNVLELVVIEAML